jgi:ABC-2 type transport system permease protein
MTAHAETTYPRPGLPLLSRVELRKMADTRAGFWLLLVVALLGVAIVTITLIAGKPEDQDLHSFFQGALWVVSVLLPVVGILAVTGEWTQRTGLTTFALVPERGRVIAAKVIAAIGLALAAAVACLVAAAAGNLIAGGSWDLPVWLLSQGALFEVIGMLFGVAFGLVFMNSALAIVLYFLLPTAWTILGETIHALDKPANWLDLSRTMERLVDGSLTGTEWAQLGTSVGLWVGLVLLIGLWRLRRIELK